MKSYPNYLKMSPNLLELWFAAEIKLQQRLKEKHIFKIKTTK